MLVTTTLVFLAFTVWTASGWLRALVASGAQAAARRERAWLRLRFLGGLGLFLVAEYTVYLSHLRR